MTNPLMPGLAKELVKYYLEQNKKDVGSWAMHDAQNGVDFAAYDSDRFTDWVLGMIDDGDLVVEVTTSVEIVDRGEDE